MRFITQNQDESHYNYDAKRKAQMLKEHNCEGQQFSLLKRKIVGGCELIRAARRLHWACKSNRKQQNAVFINQDQTELSALIGLLT